MVGHSQRNGMSFSFPTYLVCVVLHFNFLGAKCVLGMARVLVTDPDDDDGRGMTGFYFALWIYSLFFF